MRLSPAVYCKENPAPVHARRWLYSLVVISTGVGVSSFLTVASVLTALSVA
jgi:hypothetical protein